MSETKKYGLILPSKLTKAKTVVNKASVFGNDDDDEGAASSVGQKKQGRQGDSKINLLLKRQTQLHIEKALQDDPTVYEYDTIYDNMHAEKEEKLATSKSDRKPKYIDNLMKAAAQRKKELERRIEKTVQKEREAEKGMFDDKEAFVTDAYRRKMKEMQEDEERERLRDEMEAKMDVTKQSDLSSFYANILRQTSGEMSDVKTTPAALVKQEPSEISPKARVAEAVVAAFPDDRDDSQDSSDASQSDNDDRRLSRNPDKRRRKTANKQDDTKDSRRVERDGQKDGHDDLDHKHRRSDDIHRTSERDKHHTHRDKHSSKEKHDDLDRSNIEHGSAVDGRGEGRDHNRHSERREHDRTDTKGNEKRWSETESSKKHSNHPRSDAKPDKNEKKISKDEAFSNNKGLVPCDDDYSNSDESSSSDDERTPRKRSAVQTKKIPAENATCESNEAKFSKKTVGDSLDDARARFLARKKTLAVPVVRGGDDSD